MNLLRDDGMQRAECAHCDGEGISREYGNEGGTCDECGGAGEVWADMLPTYHIDEGDLDDNEGESLF